MQEQFMQKCLELAKKGYGLTSPNPLVGCVVTDEFGNIVATGYHHKYGEPHAERDALNHLNKGEGHTLYVNLEPCSHYGKTPPCTDIIIEKGIKHVVVGMKDPNPKVSGIEVLRSAGVEVTSGVLEDESKELNEVFIKNITKGKVFVALKTATTLDGKIATYLGSSKWITSEIARAEVKNIRNMYDAIMTSSSTIIADNPNMLHRKKVILDRELRTNLNSNIYKNGEIFIFNEKKEGLEGNLHFLKSPVVDGKMGLEFVFNKLYELGIMSVLIESGGKLAGRALRYTDKIYHFIAPKITGDNASISCFDYRSISDISECRNFEISRIEKYGPDVLLVYKPVIL